MFIIKFIILPLIIGIASTIMVECWKKRKKEYSISYLIKANRTYRLKEKGDVKISLTYKDRIVDSSLTVFILQLNNSGKKDIFFQQHFSSPIKIKIDGWKCIGASVINENSNIKPNISLNSDGYAELNWDIIKKKEIIEIELVAMEQQCNDCLPQGNISFDFRSDCLDKFDLFERFPSTSVLIISFLFIMAIIGAFFSYTEKVEMNIIYNGTVYTDAKISYNRLMGKFNINTADGNVAIPTDQIKTIQAFSIHRQDGISTEMVALIVISVILIIELLYLKCMPAKEKKMFQMLLKQYMGIQN